MKNIWFACALLLAFTLNAPDAWAAPQTTDTQFVEIARNRVVPLRVRIPDGTGKVPLVIFSHGLGGSRDGGKLWGEHWAVNGYLVIHVQHPGSDSELLKTGSGAPLQRLKRGVSAEQLIARAADVSFVLDEIARRQANGEQPFTRIDLDRVAMTGHSFGASTTMALADQRYANTDRTLADARMSAFIALSPQMPQTQVGSTFNAFGNVKQPLFVITGTLDGDMLGTGASPDKRAAVFDALPAGGKYRVVFDNGDHMVFGGGAQRESGAFLQYIGNAGAQTNAATAALIQVKIKALTLKFLDAHLKNDASAKQWLSQEARAYLGDAGKWDAK